MVDEFVEELFGVVEKLDRDAVEFGAILQAFGVVARFQSFEGDLQSDGKVVGNVHGL
jgi:hypothetical protein